MAHGVFRDEGFAQVDHDGIASYPMPQDEYVAKHILPPFEDLPTLEEFLAKV